MIYLSAGHHNNDPGAVANGKKESALTIEFRELVSRILSSKGYSHIKDKDNETNIQYQNRIKPGPGSVLLDIHFNAAGNSTATGTEYIVSSTANQNSKNLAKELVDGTARILGIANRGVKSELQSRRGKLGILHQGAGISVLAEICFLTNKSDLEKYESKKNELASLVAELLIKYENLVP